MKYAENTTVSVANSKIEIEKTLLRYNSDQFVSGWDQEKAYIGFLMEGRMIKFTMSLPLKEDFRVTPSGRRKRSTDDMLKAWEQACRQRWRALSLVIKAKLEAVESGITSFQDEFLAHILLPDGSTVGEFIEPQVAIAYEQKKMPKLLPWK